VPDNLRAWAIAVLRFALREPRVASGEAVLHVVDSEIEGPHRFRGTVLPGDRAVAAEALRRARAEEGAPRWAVVFLTWLPEREEAWLITDCAEHGDEPSRFATRLLPNADADGTIRMAAGRLVALGKGGASF